MLELNTQQYKYLLPLLSLQPAPNFGNVSRSGIIERIIGKCSLGVSIKTAQSIVEEMSDESEDQRIQAPWYFCSRCLITESEDTADKHNLFIDHHFTPITRNRNLYFPKPFKTEFEIEYCRRKNSFAAPKIY